MVRSAALQHLRQIGGASEVSLAPGGIPDDGQAGKADVYGRGVCQVKDFQIGILFWSRAVMSLTVHRICGDRDCRWEAQQRYSKDVPGDSHTAQSNRDQSIENDINSSSCDLPVAK
jgi:hypothetical protein